MLLFFTTTESTVHIFTVQICECNMNILHLVSLSECRYSSVLAINSDIFCNQTGGLRDALGNIQDSCNMQYS